MVRVKVLQTLSILILLFSLGGTSAFAQFSSGIEGTVHDSSGALVAGATVTVTNTRLGIVRTAATDQSGYFRIGSIAASTYSLQIKMRGFSTYEQKDLALEVGELRTFSPVLAVGSASTEVTVSASQAAINLSTATTGSVISEETVHQTP